jgi:hypothetical protein
MTSPFDYPPAPMVRRHQPRGYTSAASFRPWLRDDFAFRCVFCGLRETWQPGDLDVEHFEPAGRVPARALDYQNLLYACRTCNGKKGGRAVPDPTVELLRGVVTMDENGLLVATSPQARELILVLGLNTRRQRTYRRIVAEVLQMAEQNDPALYRQLMGYPDELPDLSRLRPPGGNGKPEGVAASHFARRERGELPESY